MGNVVHIPKEDDFREFIDFLWEGLEGIAYLVAKIPDDEESWDQAFFEWPLQRERMIAASNTYSSTHEIYVAPALFKSKNGLRENVKYTNVLWTEFDGNTPSEFDVPPSLIVRSSEPGHEHVYWKLTEPLSDIDQIEDYNRRVCFKYGADNSAWEANQVLRPPYTLNHKRGSIPVATIHKDLGVLFSLAVFDDLAPAPEKTVDYSLWEKIDLPRVQDVIYRNRFGPDFSLLFERTKDEVHDRSATLTNMAFICAEAGLTDKEIYSILDHLATRWEKFKHHTKSSRAKQLISIIEHTRIKYPHSNFSELDQVFEYSPKALLETDIQVEWAIENMLMKNGCMLLAGQSGVGKTRFSMQFMFHLAMGIDFLHYKIPEPKKLGFFSLEMGDLELKSFLQQMYPHLVDKYGTEKVKLLNENLNLLPFGESLPLNTQRGQDVVLEYIEAHTWDGIFIDSVGSSIMGNISSSETVQAFTNFNDKLRKRYSIFLWYIHHLRKSPPGQKPTGDQNDVYGDQYLAARSTSVYTAVEAKDGLVRIYNPKNRHSETEKPFILRREYSIGGFVKEDIKIPDGIEPVTVTYEPGEAVSPL